MKYGGGSRDALPLPLVVLLSPPRAGWQGCGPAVSSRLTTVSLSPPETGESLASEFLFSDVCRVGAGENCSSPAPQEGRSPQPEPHVHAGPAGGVAGAVTLSQTRAGAPPRHEAGGRGERLGGGARGGQTPWLPVFIRDFLGAHCLPGALVLEDTVTWGGGGAGAGGNKDGAQKTGTQPHSAGRVSPGSDS